MTFILHTGHTMPLTRLESNQMLACIASIQLYSTMKNIYSTGCNEKLDSIDEIQ